MCASLIESIDDGFQMVVFIAFLFNAAFNSGQIGLHGQAEGRANAKRKGGGCLNVN